MILTLDFETTNITSQRRKANQFDPRNRVVCAAYKIDENPVEGTFDYTFHIPERVKLIVGQNLKFDLLWFWATDEMQNYLARGGMLWDTLTAEHLIRGGEKGLPKDLDSLALRYGANIKDEKIKEFLKKGGNPAEYPDQDELLEYCKADVDNTYHVFKEQYKLAKKLNMLKVIKIYMRHYPAVCDMEFNGLRFDRDALEAIKLPLERELETIANKIKAIVTPFFPSNFNFNPAANRQISVVLFGGELKVKYPKPLFDPNSGLPLLVKSKSSKDYGKQKTKLTDEMIQIEGYQYDPKDIEKDSYGYFKTGESILLKLPQNEFIELVLEYRAVAKKLKTYVYGFEECINPNDGLIHADFKPTGTVTFRLSSGDPNIQNLSPAIHPAIVSRYEGGVLFSVDFSSMEVFILAIRSQCPVLIADLKRPGFDMHKNSATFTLNCDASEVTAEQRRQAKTMTFRLTYGASPEGTAKTLGLPIEMCERFFRGFYTRYYGVCDLHRYLKEELYLNAEPTNDLLPIYETIRDKQGNKIDELRFTRPDEYQYRSFIYNQFGQRWCLRDIGRLTKNGFVRRGWPTTDMKNYSVQGTASLFVNLGVSLLWEELAKIKNYTRLINEVHDEVWIDVASTHVEQVKEILHNTMGKVSQQINRIFDMDVGLDIGIEIGIGNTIAEAKAK